MTQLTTYEELIERVGSDPELRTRLFEAFGLSALPGLHGRMDAFEHTQQGVLDTQQGMLDTIQDIQGTQKEIRDTQRGMLNTQQRVLDTQQGVLDTQQGILNTIQDIQDTQNEMRDTQKGMLDTQQGMLNTIQEIQDTQKEIRDTQRGMLDTQQGVLDTQQGILNTIQDIQGTQNEMRDTQKGMLNTIQELQDTQKGMLNTIQELQDTQKGMLNTIQELQDTQKGMLNTQNALLKGQDSIRQDIKALHGMYRRQHDDQSRFRGAYAIDATRANEVAIALLFAQKHGLRRVSVSRFTKDERDEMMSENMSALESDGLLDRAWATFAKPDLVAKVADLHRREFAHYSIAVEASFTAGMKDLARAIDHAKILRCATGKPAYAVVASVRLDRQVESQVVADVAEFLEAEDEDSAFWYRLDEEELEPLDPC